MKKPETKLDADGDEVCVGQKALTYQKYEYYMFHKPAGCVTATQDNLHQTVMDFISSGKKEELFPVGRLDKDTEGLLLITNDGALAHELLSRENTWIRPTLQKWKARLPKQTGILFAGRGYRGRKAHFAGRA